MVLTSMVDHHFYPVPISLLSLESLFVTQLGGFVLISFSCKLSAYVNHQTKVATMPTNIRPVIIESNVRFSGLGLSQRKMTRIPTVSHGVFVRAVVLPRGYIGISWRRLHKKRPCPSPYHEVKQFSLSVQLDPCLVHTVHGHLVPTGYYSRHPDAKIHHTFNNMTQNSGIPIGVIKSDHGLISKYHMRPVLMATVLMPTCQHAMAGAMVRSLVGISLAISSCYQTFLHCVDKDTSDQLHPDPGCCERTISPHNMAKSVVFFDVLSRY